VGIYRLLLYTFPVNFPLPFWGTPFLRNYFWAIFLVGANFSSSGLPHFGHFFFPPLVVCVFPSLGEIFFHSPSVYILPQIHRGCSSQFWAHTRGTTLCIFAAFFKGVGTLLRVFHRGSFLNPRGSPPLYCLSQLCDGSLFHGKKVFPHEKFERF